MNKVLRLSLALGALAVAAASQAFALNYAGSGAGTPNAGSFTTTSLGYLGDYFAFAKSTTTPATNTIVLSDGSGLNGLTLTYTASYSDADLFAGYASYVGFGAYSGLTSGSAKTLSIVRNKTTVGSADGYVINIQGNAVPEPASIAALSVGAAALLRRRKKA